MAELEIHQFLCLSDNYGFLVHDADSGVTGCIDTPEVAPILAALDETGWSLTHILNTHWHPDHAGGNLEIQGKTGCQIIGPRDEQERIPGIQTAVGDGDVIDFGGHTVKVFDVPGHTSGHVAYWFPDDGVSFVGDTVFALGCGRIFEGTPELMWSSIQKLMALPPETLLYCAHEYTEANARFAVTVDPDNGELLARVKEIEATRAAGKWTVPSTLELELRTNPFLRPDAPGLQKAIGMEGADPVAVFAETRARKDSF
ncbi:MAG: hydroxyacylglutathione hydrolase [Deltaproteobacteria bacterium]|nr:hydroxyacylglutathione hydrolase [Deltaproteobacteria bacterium]